MDYICADCGMEAPDMSPCKHCGSYRTVLKSFVEDVTGPDWRKTCFPKEIYPKAWEQEGWNDG